MRTLHKVLGGLGVVVAIVAVALIVYFTTKAQCTPSETPYGTTTPSPATRDPVVRVEQGLLEGLNKRTRGQGGVEYAAFWGIPFAQAPVGPLRFKAPRPHPGWTGVRPAKKPGPQCFQAGAPWDHLMGKSLGNAGGSEDCLFVNVFTTNLNRTEKLPVYVFVHGGGFNYGSPTDFGPDYLLPHGIVLVTFQYRLQALGFLSLDTEEIPGNCGVKDNVAALRWVNKNIAAFGGDPSRVTIGGQSAGGALAGWLSVLPEMDGLIHGATLMSGSAFHNWVYTESHVATALRVASRLAGQPVTDLTLAAQYLMNATVQEIVKHAQDVGNAVQTDPLLPWVPTPERRKPLHGGEPLLITRDAESYFLKPARTPIPQLISNTNAEWRLYYYSHNPTLDPKVDEKIVENVYDHVPRNVFPFQDTRKILNVPEVQVNYSTVYEEVKRGIRDAVTPACNLGCTVKTYIDDIWMETDAHRLAMFRAKNTKADTFLFKFSTRTELNMPAPNPNEAKDVAFHADDVAYILARPIDTNPSPKADLAIRRMATMWTNFVKYGKPITQTDELLPVDWPAISATDDLGTYLELKTDGFTLQTDSFSGPMFQFWQNLYQKYRTPSPAPAAA